LVRADDENQASLATTTCWWGPRKHPVVSIGEDKFEVTRKGVFTRSCEWQSRRFGKLEWRYGSRSERGALPGNISSLLILEKVTKEVEGEQERTMVARLIRGDETRTPGTGSWSSGNGGQLEIFAGDIQDEEEFEAMVVSTCLLMLKKEIDRKRRRQIMAMGASGCIIAHCG